MRRVMTPPVTPETPDAELEAITERLKYEPQGCPDCRGTAYYIGRMGTLECYRCTRCGKEYER